MKKTTGKLVVMGVSFALGEGWGLFLGGAAALQVERGTTRTVILALVFAGLLTIAGVQTLRHLKGKK